MFLDFCYLVRQEVIDTTAIAQIEDALARFHENCTIFVEAGIWDKSYTPPQQHSLEHYLQMIRDFGAPNGLCSSITESKHIKAMKEPWRRSNRYNALQQMIMNNLRMDKLVAAQTYFEAEGMLESSSKSGVPIVLEDDDGDVVDSQTMAPLINLAVKPFRMSIFYFTCCCNSLPTDRTTSSSPQSSKALQAPEVPRPILALHDIS